MDSILLNLGPITIKWYSFIIAISVIVASYIIQKESKKKQLDEDNLINIISYGVIIGILGARTYYVLFNLNYYYNNISEIFMIWHGGLAIHGGILAALIFLIFYCRKHQINLFLLLDIIVVGLLIAQSIGRWGNFFNQEAYGRIVSKSFLESIHLPEFIIRGMYISGQYREPTYLYESILSFIGFIFLILIRNVKQLKTGMLSGIYLVWYGISRLIIETFRSDSLMFGPLKMAQLVSVIGIIIGAVIIIKSRNNELYYTNKLKQ